MDIKILLRNFWQLGYVIVIFGLQALSMFLIAYSIGLIAMGYGVRGCPPRPDYFEWFSLTKIILTALLGLSAFIISLYYIVQPSIWMQTINKNLALASTDINQPFFSTHPLYVFLDILLFIPAVALFQGGRAETLCQLNAEWAIGWVLLIIALFFPVFRIFCWYVLRRKIQAMTLKKPWLPIVLWYVFALPLMFYVTFTYMNNRVYSKLRVPVVNEKTFKGGLDKHPEFLDGIVRVQGVLKREIAKCGLFGKDPKITPYPYGTVLLDMGKRNGQIMVQAKKPSLVKTLEIEAQNKKGKIFEAFGRLSKLPNPDKKLVCGIGKAKTKQKGGLALLEIEMP